VIFIGITLYTPKRSLGARGKKIDRIIGISFNDDYQKSIEIRE